MTAIITGIHGLHLATARRNSLCWDDAQDALSEAYVIAWRHRDRIRPETADAWFHVVVRNEARGIRRHQAATIPHDEIDLNALPSTDAEPPDPPDPRIRRLRRAMQQLKPDQRLALGLLYSLPGPGRYAHIMRLTGWTYTKTNRSIAEGRQELRRLLGVEP